MPGSATLTRRAAIQKTAALAFCAPIANCVAAAAAPAVEEPLPGVLRPYLQNPGGDAMTVCVPSQQGEPVSIEWSVGDGPRQKAEARPTAIPNSPWTIWKCRLGNLQPGATVEYSAGGGEQFAFRMLDGADPVTRCVIVNDIHNRVATLEAVMQHVPPAEFDFSVLNGDMIHDPQDLTTILRCWNEYVRLLDGSRKPMLFARGNHEYRGRWWGAIACLLDLPHLDSNAAAPEQAYHFEWKIGVVRIIATDTGEDDSEETPDDNYRHPKMMRAIRERQAEWLAALAAETAPPERRWHLFVSHIPLFDPAGWRSVPSRKLWLESLEKMRVDLAVSGHDHNWKFVPRGRPYTLKEKTDSHEETPSFDTLIGGGPALEEGTAIVLRANRAQLETRMLDAHGKLLHEFRV